MDRKTEHILIERAARYNDPVYFTEDPVAFPREMAARGASRQDIEIAAIFSSHLAWGRRSMIVRDCTRLFDHMEWRPYDYVMAGDWRSDDTSLHRTVKWSEIAAICARLKQFYSSCDTLENMPAGKIRTEIFSRKEDPKAADKKIHMMRRWLVRRDGKVDLGIWTDTDPACLIIPLDVHVYAEALELGLTNRHSKDLATALQITEEFRGIWPQDPCLGDFALFGYGIDK